MTLLPLNYGFEGNKAANPLPTLLPTFVLKWFNIISGLWSVNLPWLCILSHGV